MAAVSPPSSTDLRESQEGLVTEIKQAFHPKKKKRKNNSISNTSSSTKTLDSTWLYQQCCIEGVSGRNYHYPLFTGDRSKLTLIEKQTYKKWKSVMEFEKVKHPKRQRRKVIIIQPISYNNQDSSSVGAMDTIVATDTTTEEMEYRHSRISDGVLDLLCEFCTAYFHGMSVKVAPPLDLGEIPRLRSRVHKSTNRRQFLVDDIIHYLSVRRLQKGYCILGVTVVDLYPGPNWNFVLGQACMLKGSGVFSFGRYFNNKSGGHVTGRGDHVTGSGGGDMEWEHDQMKNLWVLMRVMSHELCHLFGMSHCHYFQCAVNESSSIAEAATRQPLTLCPICLKKLRKILKFDLLERYTALWKVTEKLKLIVTGVLESEISTLGEIPSHNTPHSLKGEVTSSESSDGRDTTCGGGNGDTAGNGGMEDTAGNGGVEDTAGNGGVDSTASNGGIDSNGDTTVNRGMDSSEDIVCSEASLANGHLDHMNRAVDWLGEVIQDLEKYRQTRSREDEGNDGDGNLTSETGGGRGRGREAGGDGVNVMSDSEDDAEETTALTNHGQTNHRQTRVCCL